ncbi:molybdopterin-guanine dinucleotide biosynthesis protein MobA [Arthrobacter ulcerisalmonis]|uniref:Molybdopterin-guanine dinucleotide biosynthesis protein MobA n=1 Tax=Arthrobacter ulcerisalmonis TaxID=2483813 RepID=A0A3P5WZP1_9MICC|nr:NTP transferase domain-containing protein [Arthrobacter ulcerisalmonis]VDC23806.1 molybdopterin-guanine dinucleotide biosynthesis protein MobA [Arthrobacter ulcerisalmonis]
MPIAPLALDAVILAGGRSARLGGVSKATLVLAGTTLLGHAVQAAAGAGVRRIVVVGPTIGSLPADILTCREDPPFAGPAAAIACGLGALAAASPAEVACEPCHVLVLACDMPLAAGAVAILRAALPAAVAAGRRGVMASTSAGERQFLLGIYDTDELKSAARGLQAKGRLVDGSVRSLLANLDVQLVTVPSEYTADVDTWADAAAGGIAGAHGSEAGQECHGPNNPGGDT